MKGTKYPWVEMWRRVWYDADLIDFEERMLFILKLSNRMSLPRKLVLKRYLKRKGANFTFSFLILHELSALVSLPIVYFSIPSSLAIQPSEKVKKVLSRYSISVSPDTLFRMGVAYSAVKLLMPVRLVASIWLTPAFSSRVVVPLRHRIFR